MKFFKSIQIVMFALATLLLVSCNENDVIDPGAVAPNAPTSLMAQSRNGAVGLKWTAPVTGAVPTGYRVMYRESGTTGSFIAVNVVGTGTTGVVNGLTNGKAYDFMVHALNDTLVSPASNTITWAPAARTTTALRLYSSKNSSEGSGAAIWRAGGSAPVVLTIGEGQEWDICFDDKDSIGAGGAVIEVPAKICSPGFSRYVDNNFEFPNGSEAKTTYWGAQLTNITSLDDLYESTVLTVPDKAEDAFQIVGITGTGNWGSVIASKNSDGSFNFGRVMMVRTGGTFIQGSGANSYIDIIVSYQTVKNLPHAVTARLNEKLAISKGQTKLND